MFYRVPTGAINGEEWVELDSAGKNGSIQWFELDDEPRMGDPVGDRMRLWDSFNQTELYYWTTKDSEYIWNTSSTRIPFSYLYFYNGLKFLHPFFMPPTFKLRSQKYFKRFFRIFLTRRARA